MKKLLETMLKLFQIDMCNNLENISWFYETGVSNVQFPRCYNVYQVRMRFFILMVIKTYQKCTACADKGIRARFLHHSLHGNSQVVFILGQHRWTKCCLVPRRHCPYQSSFIRS